MKYYGWPTKDVECEGGGMTLLFPLPNPMPFDNTTSEAVDEVVTDEVNE